MPECTTAPEAAEKTEPQANELTGQHRKQRAWFPRKGAKTTSRFLSLRRAARRVAPLLEVQARLAPVQDLVPIGYYLGLTLAQALEGITSKDVRAFFHFVRENPRFFIGKNLRFSEAFVAWMIDHGRTDPSPT